MRHLLPHQRCGFGAFDDLCKPFDECELLAVVADGIHAGRQKRDRTCTPPAEGTITVVAPHHGRRATLSVLLRSACQVQSAGTVTAAINLLERVARSGCDRPTGRVGYLMRLLKGLENRTSLLVDPRGSVQLGSGCSGGSVTLIRRYLPVSELLREVEAIFPAYASHLRRLSEPTVRAVEYLATHYPKTTVEDAGREIDTAPYHLSGRFSREMGVSVMTYLSSVRVEVTKGRLAETDQTIDAIAERVGLRDASHLSRVFLAHMGQRPGEYRRLERVEGRNAS